MENVTPLITRQFLVDQPDGNLYPYLPKEMITLILSHLPTFKDLCDFNETCTNLYAIRKEDGLWRTLFKRCFPHLSHLIPRQTWLDLCQTEYLGVRNVINERYILRPPTLLDKLPEEVTLCQLSFTSDGRVLLRSNDHSLEIFDPLTGECTLLAALSEEVFHVECQGRFCVVQHKDTLRVWDIKTKEEIPVPYGEKGFPKGEGVFKVTLSEGQLFASFGKSDWFWDLERPEEAPWSSPLDIHFYRIAFCGRTFVFSSAQGRRIGIFNLDTKERKTFLDAIPASQNHSVPQIYSFSETLFCTWSKPSRIERSLYPHLYVWDLEGKQLTADGLPLPSKIISWSQGSYLFHVVWDAACPQSEWTEGVNKYPGDAPVCSFPELSFLFQKYVFQAGALHIREPGKDPALHKIFKQFNSLAWERCSAYQNGKFFCPTPDFKSIQCVDFTASDREILEDILKALEDAENNPIEADNARGRFERMPKPMRDAIDQDVEEAISKIRRPQNPDPKTGIVYAQQIKINPILAAAIRKYLENFKK